MQSSGFQQPGLFSSTSNHHSQSNFMAWGGSSQAAPANAPPLNDSLTQSRSQYQTGYLISSQPSNPPQGSPRSDEPPMIQTKAKMSHVLTRGSNSEFGMESMFQSSRSRQPIADEDAPPTASINDLPNQMHVEPTPPQFQPRSSAFGFDIPQRRTPRPAQPQPPPSTSALFVLVFGFPPDEFITTAEYFQSLGDATEPERTDVANCFRIGYRNPTDALRAVRKNGEVLGNWMVGAIWADPAVAQAQLGPALLQSSGFVGSPTGSSPPASTGMEVDRPLVAPGTPNPNFHNSNFGSANAGFTPNSNLPAFGTPIKLGSSASVFKKNNPAAAAPATPVAATKPWGASGAGTPAAQTSPNKGVVAQVSDMLFGW
ncbi:hypothetical protein BD626DRAFT_192099 [Schizophyllum amplum]|uniref:RRM Nup35-type domain-containing protein n=1 Tax=Schizophyllum amplum TaxID=97359 RepID=A0A550CLZ9_9AGAR|nr:hypothetical protein BD626DRAFT_192099 [Auriculariopsis ampla]